jgi:hypothetical protein
MRGLRGRAGTGRSKFGKGRFRAAPPVPEPLRFALMSHEARIPRSRRPSRARGAPTALVVAGLVLGAAIVRTNRPDVDRAPLASSDDAAASRVADVAPSTTLLAADPSAREAALARTLRHGPTDGRVEAVHALGEAGPSSMEAALLIGALDDEDAEVRREARLALRRSGLVSSDAVASLRRRVAGADDAEAADALRTLGAVASDRRDVLEMLADSVIAGAPARARGAATGLVLGGEPGVERLRGALDFDAEARDALRGVTVRAVADAEATRLSAALVSLLDDGRREVRLLALRSLAAADARSFGSAARAESVLTSLLASPAADAEERRLVVEALAALAPAAPSLPDALRAALDDPDPAIRGAAAREASTTR